VVVSLTEATRPSLLARLTPASVAAYCMVLPVVTIGVVTASYTGLSRAGWAVAGTAAYAPLYLRHVLSFLRGQRPRAAGWSLAGMAVLITAVLPLAGGWWLPMYFTLAVCLLLTLPWRWSLLGVALLTAAQVPLAFAFPAPAFSRDIAPSYFALTLLWRTSAVFVPVWLVATVRQLEAARQQLAQEAVLRERLVADARLRRTLGTALASIVAGGQSSARLAREDPQAAAPRLAALVDTSRRSLAETRQLLSSLHRPSLWSELEAAAGLLTAAGIETRLTLAGGSPPDGASAEFRSRLRSATADLLRDGSVRTCVITVSSGSEQVHLEILVGDRQLASMEITAP
jgi:two-component system sensor histidine kinase DesK